MAPVKPLTSLPFAQWPVAPYSGKPYIYQGGLLQATRIEDMQDGTPPGDVVEFSDASKLPEDLGGLLIYAENTSLILGSGSGPGMGFDGGINDYIAFHYMNRDVNRGAASHYYRTYTNTMNPKDGLFPLDLFDVSLSEDANTLMFAGGGVDRYGKRSYFSWDLKNKKFMPLFSGWVGARDAFNARATVNAYLSLQDTEHFVMEKQHFPLGREVCAMMVFSTAATLPNNSNPIV